jgi:two-component system, OmpR family, response regulator RegX3
VLGEDHSLCQRDVVLVLIVEDDDRIAQPLIKGLEHEGLSAEHVATGGGALARMQSASDPAPDVVLLDLRLPDVDGFEVCRGIRALSEVPIIVVTARGEEVDKVLGLELGADDYVVKPFGFRELLARIKAVTRRTGGQGSVLKVIDIGPLRIDRRTRRALIDGEEISLTAKEFDLLALLAEDPDAVWPRVRILEEVWDAHWYGPTKTLDVHIASLRKKLGHPDWIETVRGVGFRLRVQPES